MSIRCAATRRWFVVVLLAVAVLAAPAIGSAKPQKTIVVSISQQMLWAYKGNRVVLNTYVSTGRTGFDTPVGSFAVLTKLPSQTMEGVIGGEYYNVGFITGDSGADPKRFDGLRSAVPAGADRRYRRERRPADPRPDG